LGDLDSALRCAERSLAASPMVDPALLVAGIHLQRGDVDKWEQTLIKFLETPDLGLQHGAAERALAYGYASRGQWQKARPYAVDFGQTWADRGLRVAADITEGLAEWQESEQWARELAESYPSAEAPFWYLWCRRTGRGDLEAAKRLAEPWLGGGHRQTREFTMVEAVYYYTDGNLSAALASYQAAAAFRASFGCSLMVAHLARKVGDENTRTEALNAIQKAYLETTDQQTPDEAKTGAAGMAILQLMKSGDASPEKLAKIEELLSVNVAGVRTGLATCLALELDALGKKDEAEKYWRRAIVTVDADVTAATLAGFELAKRHGTSRPDGDVLDEDDLWPAPQSASGTK
jgi:tetratricopeptide (TPR) repeat protein